MYKRGEIYYIEPSKTLQTTGSEQRPNRPGVIVSNDENNEKSSTVEIVYLTTQPKNEIPTHVIVNSSARQSTALCEQITTVAIERIADYMGQCTEEEMEKIENAMIKSLGIKPNNIIEDEQQKKKWEKIKYELEGQKEIYQDVLKFIIKMFTEEVENENEDNK